MTQLAIEKLDAAGNHMITYEATLVRVIPGGVEVEATWEHATRELGYVTFVTGDDFHEWHFRDRWYSVYRVASPSGALKGWYCNISYPAEITADAITFRDLLLDLWVAPDGSTLTLDEDEFTAAPLNDETRQYALAAVAELRALAAASAEMFA
ncbi:MAG TPA: DUF402 domain-containing protein [Ktedonobacterales bacterium]